MSRQPRAAEQNRRPPRVAGEHDGGCETADHLNQATRDEVHGDRQRRSGHAKVKIARDRQIVGELRVLEVTHARRAHARVGQPVVEPGGGAIAEVRADRLVDRSQHLEQHENDAAERDRAREAVTPLHRADERAHGDRKRRGQRTSQHEDDPPDNREGAVGLRQHAEKLPLVTLTQATEQWSPLTGSWAGSVPSSKAHRGPANTRRVRRIRKGVVSERNAGRKQEAPAPCYFDQQSPSLPLPCGFNSTVRRHETSLWQLFLFCQMRFARLCGFLFNRTHHKDAKNLYYEALISCQAGKNFIRLSLGAHASSELTVSQLTEHARCVRSQEASSPVFGEIFLVAAGLLCVHRKEMKR